MSKRGSCGGRRSIVDLRKEDVRMITWGEVGCMGDLERIFKRNE